MATNAAAAAASSDPESKEGGGEAPPATVLHGDFLDSVLTRVPTADLVAASHVSTVWRHAVCSSLLLRPRRRPWLLLHLQNRVTRRCSTTHAFDPHARSWCRVVHHPSEPAAPLHSSGSPALLYSLTSSRLAFSVDPFHRKWVEMAPPRVCRSDPVVAAVGASIVVAGGAYDFEDDPCSTEVFDASADGGGGVWSSGKPIPEELQCSAAATWLSAAVAGEKLHVVERNRGLFCSFDHKSKTWGEVSGPITDPSFSRFAIAGGGATSRRLLLAGLGGEHGCVTGVRLWEVDWRSNGPEAVEVGHMPPGLVSRMADSCGGREISSFEIRTAGEEADLVYVYGSPEPEEIYYCDMSGGGCEWGCLRNPAADDGNLLKERFVFTCSPVRIDDLSDALRPPPPEPDCRLKSTPVVVTTPSVCL